MPPLQYSCLEGEGADCFTDMVQLCNCFYTRASVVVSFINTADADVRFVGEQETAYRKV